MFVKKLVEKGQRALEKHGVTIPGAAGPNGGSCHGLQPEDVSPRLVFHYGIPSAATSLAADRHLQLLAVATRNGQIKVFGRDNTQALLQSPSNVATKFLKFMDRKGILLNVDVQNRLEVWDITVKQLSYEHTFREDITAFAVLKMSWYIFIGYVTGDVSIFMLDNGQQHIVEMTYRIPFNESYGSSSDGNNGKAIASILPQPMAEYNRVLIIFKDGHASLWDIKESKVVFTFGPSTQIQLEEESFTVLSACWACAMGSKVAVGYDNGNIYIWAVPLISKVLPADKSDASLSQNLPLYKLNLGYKVEKIPVVSLWSVIGDEKTCLLYINGYLENGSSCLFQVLALNSGNESRSKVVLPLTEPCVAMELVKLPNDNNKLKNSALVVLLKSGRICLFDDSDIQQHLLQPQSSLPSTLQNQVVRLPYSHSTITAAKLYTNNVAPSISTTIDHCTSANKYPPLFTLTKEKSKEPLSSVSCSDLHKIKVLFITGHLDGSITIWDASCPLLLPVMTIKRLNEDRSSNSTSITSLLFDIPSRYIVAGEQSGMVHLIMLKDASENKFSFLQGKTAENYSVRCLKLKGVISSLSLNADSKHVVAGTDQGFVAIINIEDASILYQKQFECRTGARIISLQFAKYSQNNCVRSIILVGMEDTSLLFLKEESGKLMSSGSVQTKKPSKALLIQALDLTLGAAISSDNQDISDQCTLGEASTKQSLLLLCSENAVRLFSQNHAVQGNKKLISKKKLGGSCCYASVLHCLSAVGLVLIFSCGKVEIRSLPELAILKEYYLRGFTDGESRSLRCVISSSSDGEFILVNGDQEVLYFSSLCREDSYRQLESISMLSVKDVSLQEVNNPIYAPKEKKKGIFATVMKESKGSRMKLGNEASPEEVNLLTSENLSSVFSVANFPAVDKGGKKSLEDDEVPLDIDDIELEDAAEKQIDSNISVKSKHKLARGLQSLKEKFKPKADDKVNTANEKIEETPPKNAVDQIKMKYGYSSNDEQGDPKIIQAKLHDNIRKLEGIDVRSKEMMNNAQTFSSMAKELLRAAKGE